MNVRIITLKEWAICGHCGAKLFKIYDKAKAQNMEIKCHQCKTLNTIHIDNNKGGKNE